MSYAHNQLKHYKYRDGQNILPDLWGKKSMMLCFIAGNDGYLRVIDLTNDRPIFLWKYEGVGLNGINISQEEDIVCIGTQDDAVVILNLEN